jgi:RNA polymerase sigma-70 factor (ECF subfamily)
MGEEVQTTSTEPELTRLYREEGARLWRAVFAYAGDREISSDAVAEAFAQYARRGERVRQPAAWIWRAAFKIAAGELQRRSRQGPMPRHMTYEVVDRVPVTEALARLSPRQRAAIVLHYYAGYSAAEIAQILAINPATVRVHMLQARRKLSSLLQEEDDV